jgi:hypothetical protein
VALASRPVFGSKLALVEYHRRLRRFFAAPDGTLADTCASTSGGPATSPEAIAPPASDNLCGLHGTLIHPIEPWKRDHVAGREARPCSTMQPSGRVGLNVEGRRE